MKNEDIIIENRYRILNVLKESEGLTATKIRNALQRDGGEELFMPTIYYHLDILLKNGFIVREVSRKMSVYGKETKVDVGYYYLTKKGIDALKKLEVVYNRNKK